MSICHHCKNNVPQDSNFCPICGIKVERPKEETSKGISNEIYATGNVKNTINIINDNGPKEIIHRYTKKCDACGILMTEGESDIFFCPHCGKYFCKSHFLPEEKMCTKCFNLGRSKYKSMGDDEEAEHDANVFDNRILDAYRMDYSTNKLNLVNKLYADMQTLPPGIAAKVKNASLLDKMHKEVQKIADDSDSEATNLAKNFDRKILELSKMKNCRNKTDAIEALYEEFRNLSDEVFVKMKNVALLEKMHDKTEKEKNKTNTSSPIFNQNKSLNTAKSEKVISDDSCFEILGTQLIRYTGNDTRVAIPNGVTYIRKSAFCENKSIVQLVIPLSVTLIEDYAFEGCSNLRGIRFEGSEEKWGEVKIVCTEKQNNSNLWDSYLLRESEKERERQYNNFLAKIYIEYAQKKDSIAKKFFSNPINLLSFGTPIIAAIISLCLYPIWGLWAMVLIGVAIAAEAIAIWSRFDFSKKLDKGSGLFGPIVLLFLIIITAGAFIFISRETAYIALPVFIVGTIFLVILAFKAYNYYNVVWLPVVCSIVSAILLIISIIWCVSVWGIQSVSIDFGEETVIYRLNRDSGTLVAEPQEGGTILKKFDAPNADSVIVSEGYTKLSENALSYCDNMTVLYLPSTLTSIPGGYGELNGGAGGCKMLKTIYIGYNSDGTKSDISSQLSFIGYLAFADSPINTVYYNGTMSEWKSIEKEKSSVLLYKNEPWRAGIGEYKVVCNDGTLECDN